MKKQQIMIILTQFFAYMTLAALLLAHFALTDIFHGNEPDLSAEWWVLRLAFGVVVLFVFSVLFMLKTTKTPIKK